MRLTSTQPTVFLSQKPLNAGVRIVSYHETNLHMLGMMILYMGPMRIRNEWFVKRRDVVVPGLGL